MKDQELSYYYARLKYKIWVSLMTEMKNNPEKTDEILSIMSRL